MTFIIHFKDGHRETYNKNGNVSTKQTMDGARQEVGLVYGLNMLLELVLKEKKRRTYEKYKDILKV